MEAAEEKKRETGVDQDSQSGLEIRNRTTGSISIREEGARAIRGESVDTR